MAVYQIFVSESVCYFIDFEKAKTILKSKPKSDFKNVSLIKADENTGEFKRIDFVNVFKSDKSLRKLTSDEFDNLSELYITSHVPSKFGPFYELYIDTPIICYMFCV